jgi:hypothetical protein
VNAVPPPSWIQTVAKWFTPSRIRAHALILVICIWGTCAFNFATPSLFDRFANIKFQDFLPFYVSAQLIAQGRTSDLYKQDVIAQSIHFILGAPSHVVLPNLYGPQVGLLFVPLVRFSFPIAARIWMAISLIIVFACVFSVWKSCFALRSHARLVVLCTLAFPPLFHTFVRGQVSALVLLCFTAAYLAFRANRNWWVGVALGLLIFKPQFLVAIPLVFLFAGAWKALSGLAVSAVAQLALTTLYFGTSVMRAYFDTLSHLARVADSSELSFAFIQMHSLRSFWSLLLPWRGVAFALYAVSFFLVAIMAAAIWKSSAPIALRFSALTLAAVLGNPHLFVYDLLVLAPVFLLLVDFILEHPGHPSVAVLRLLLYLTFLLPLFGPLSRWTHFQLSVPVFAMLLCLLWRNAVTASHKLASSEFGGV